MRTGADNSGSWLSFLVDGHLADRCGQVRTSLVPGCPQLADIGRTGVERCGQLWFLGVSPSWRTSGGQLRTGADKSGSWVSSVGGHLVDRCGQVRTGVDRCGKVMFLGVT